MPFEIKRDVIEGLGVEELVVVPFDEEFTRIEAEDFVDGVLVERLGATAGVGGGELPLRHQGPRRPRDARAHDEFETRVVPLVEVDGEIVSSTRIRALIAAGAVAAAGACSGRRSYSRGGRRGRPARGANARLSDRQPRARRRARRPGHGVYAGFANGHSGGDQRGRAPDVRDRPRPARRGLPDRTSTATCTDGSCASRSSSACAARSASERRRPDRADAARRRGGARSLCASFTPPTPPP